MKDRKKPGGRICFKGADPGIQKVDECRKNPQVAAFADISNVEGPQPVAAQRNLIPVMESRQGGPRGGSLACKEPMGDLGPFAWGWPASCSLTGVAGRGKDLRIRGAKTSEFV
ncbi:hypothetical protein J3458_005775 [Metarhizium acridum]|uniref:uncharacterized protein n=1 Tax=Metarhizium acridum TaxID=92637 RepID=UPI001C6C0CFF|nr:hypothetical protein J3458_005775 [Metarhizium acridum]